jgi:hypothetical protein
MLAAAAHLPAELSVLGCAYGTGCDGEMTQSEVLSQIARLGRDGGWLGTLSPAPEVARELIEVASAVPTEASLLAARAALGDHGPTPIRGGRRTVELGPVAAIAFLFDPHVAIGGAAPLAELVVEASSLEEARSILEAAGVRTELDYERERFAEASG